MCALPWIPFPMFPLGVHAADNVPSLCWCGARRRLPVKFSRQGPCQQLWAIGGVKSRTMYRSTPTQHGGEAPRWDYHVYR